MARNGSGTYVLPAGQPVVTGTTISSTTFNTLTSDIATALTQSLSSDGQTTPTANLPMGGYKHTNLGSGSALTDSVNLGQVQSSASQWLSGVSGTDTITAGISPTPAAYAAGQTFRFVSAGANTGAVTLNISSLGAKSVTKNGTTALAAGDIPSGAVVEVVYDGTRFQVIGVSQTSPFIDSTALVKGSADATKLLRLEVDGVTTATTRVWTVGNYDGYPAVPSTEGTSGYYLKSNGAGAQPTWTAISSGITLGTPVASTSGTAIDFTSIPAGTKRITVNFSLVSLSGTALMLVQIGDSGGIENTGYTSIASGGATGATSTAGYICTEVGNAAYTYSGSVVLSLLDSSTNTWSAVGVIGYTGTAQCVRSAGDKSLSATLDRIRITTTGADTFDAGKINIMYE